MFNKGDIVYFKKYSENLGIVLDVIVKNDIQYLLIDRGYKISKTRIFNRFGKQNIFKANKTEAEVRPLLPKNLQEVKLRKDHLSKTAEYRPLYKTSFRKFCYKKNFIKGL